jgi:DNA-binding MarR family transcriptional regulator
MKKKTDRVSKTAFELLHAAQRDLSTWTSLFHQAVADRVGLHATDHKCLDLIVRMAPITAGDLAQLTGLTTGAVTAVVDRLENHGLVERQHDTTDRRKVYIRCREEKSHEIFAPTFAALGKRMAAMCSVYSDAELELLTEFTQRASAIMKEELLQMRERKVSRQEGRS